MSTDTSLLQTPTARVRAIHCSLFPPHVLRRISAVHVTEPELMDRLRQMPNPNGMLDLNMGPSHKGLGCSTCANDHLECQGHMGHIELPLPCFGAAMIRQLYSLIKVICPFCCRLMLTQQERDQLKNKTERFLSGLVAQSTFSLATKQAKSKRNCPHPDCSMPQPKYELDGGIVSWRWESTFDIDMLRRTGWGELLERPFTAREALEIFDHVSRDDWKLLGFSPETSHPSWTIYTCVAVLPNCLRPTDRARNQQHDITLLGDDVVRKVTALKRAIAEKMPAWVPRSLHALNEWLDKAYQMMRDRQIDCDAEHPDVKNDEAEIVTFRQVKETMATYCEEEPLQTKKAKTNIRRQTRVSFLNHALNAAAQVTYRSLTSKIAAHLRQQTLPGHKWGDQELPGHILAGWSDVPFRQLAENGPRAHQMTDWIRLTPFVMWAACYVIPEFIQMSGKPEIVESIWTPSDETAGYIMAVHSSAVLEMQQAVIRMISNDGRVVPKAVVHSGRFLSSLMSHMQGKEGWFRMFMCGKRVDFSARSVVTPGAQLDAHELGVPVSIAKVLTLPEMVLPFTKLRLQEAVVNGHTHSRGAARVIEPNGRIHYLEFMSEMSDRIALSQKLEQGWVVERSLRDGDFTLFNRYPSLHRMSIQGHKVKVLTENAYGIRSSKAAPLAYALSMVTAGYFNADCDGDEMNQHLPQTAMSQMEVRHLFNVESIYLTPYAHRAGIGLIQNGLLLSYLMTCKDVFFSESQKDFLQSACQYGLRDEAMRPAWSNPRVQLWTGKQIYSQTFSPGLDLSKTVDFPASKLDVAFDESVPWPEWVRQMMHPSESFVLIQDGHHCAGRLCSKTVGKTAMSVIDVMVRDVSRRAVTKFLSDVYRMLENYLVLRGFSVGIDDCRLGQRAQEAIEQILDQIDRLPLARPLAHGYEQTDEFARREYILRVAVQKIIDMANSVMLDDLMQTKRSSENAFLAMIASGAKGKIMNLYSILTCVGQIVINGTRVHRSVAQGKPFYLRPEDTAARQSGFLRTTYSKGISAQEIIGSFFAGRESVVDTGINTSRTGYAYRRIIKGIENQRVALDGSVRDGQYMVYRVYGGTGTNPEWFESVTLRTFCDEAGAIRSKVEAMYSLKPLEEGEEFGPADEELMSQMEHYWHRAAICVKEFCMNAFTHDSNTAVKSDKELKVIVSVPFERLMNKYALAKDVNLERFIVCYDWAERAILEKILEDPVNHVSTLLGLYAKLDRDMCYEGGASASGPTRLHMWESLAGFLSRGVFSNDDWDDYSAELSACVRALVFAYADGRTRFVRSRIEPGEQCGILAAQSIGEPTTQITLNTGHNVGRGSENLQMGVPRLTEILDMTLHMKTPSMVVVPQTGVSLSELERCFKGSTLSHMLRQVEVIRDPPGDRGTCVPEDKDWLALNRLYFGPDYDDEDIDESDGRHVVASTRDYVIRYELDASRVLASKVSIVEIAQRMREEWSVRPKQTWESIYVTFTAVPTDKNLFVIRIRCSGVRCLSVDPPTAYQRRSTYRYLGTFMRKLALNSQRTIKFGLSTALKSVTAHDRAVSSGIEAGQVCFSRGVLTTRGTCLADLQTVEKVDWAKCVTNDILEAYDTLGIGAARTLVVQELMKIMSCDGTYVAFPHILAVADCIAFRGFPMRFSRHGQNRVDTSILQRASFEESAEQLVNAALFCEKDPLQGITPNLIIGQVVPAGTGTVGVHSDVIEVEGGVEKLARAATIDLDMNPSLISRQTMEQVFADKVDKRTGEMMPWTKRVKRDDPLARRGEALRIGGMFGAHKSASERVARSWLDTLGGRSGAVYPVSDLYGAYSLPSATLDDTRRGKKRVRFDE